MRKRSGGLHCQNTEELLQLAQFSQNNIGLYYDDAINQKHNKKNKKNSQNKISDSIDNKYKSKEKSLEEQKKNAFIAYRQQQLKQLNNLNKKIKCKNILIICQNPQKTREMIATCLQMVQYYSQIFQKERIPQIIQQYIQSIEEVSIIQQGYKAQTSNLNQNLEEIQNQKSIQRVIDLLIQKQNNKFDLKIYKYWFLKSIPAFQQLTRLYYKNAQNIYKLIFNEKQSSHNQMEIQSYDEHKISQISFKEIILKVILQGNQ